MKIAFIIKFQIKEFKKRILENSTKSKVKTNIFLFA